MSKSHSPKKVFNDKDASQITTANEWYDEIGKMYISQCVPLYPILKISRRKTCFFKHSLRRLLLWVCWKVTVLTRYEPELMFCGQIWKLIYKN